MKEQAYKVLGVKPEASKEEIQRAYKVKLLRYQQLGNDRTEEEEAAFREVDAAYNHLCGYDIEAEEEPNAKLKDFLRYNKEKILIGLFALFMVLIFVIQINNRVDYDLRIALVGNFSNSHEGQMVDPQITKGLEAVVKARVYGSENPIVTYTQRSKQIPHTTEYNNRQAGFMMQMQLGELDLIIFDQENYNEFMYSEELKGEYLLKLNDYVLNQNREKQIPEAFLVRDGEGVDAPVYGIRLTNTYLIEQLGLVYYRAEEDSPKTADGQEIKDEFIACIFINSSRKEIAFSAIKSFCQDFTEYTKE